MFSGVPDGDSCSAYTLPSAIQTTSVSVGLWAMAIDCTADCSIAAPAPAIGSPSALALRDTMVVRPCGAESSHAAMKPEPFPVKTGRVRFAVGGDGVRLCP